MKILIVEDDHQIANYIKQGLELKSQVVDVAYDGEEGFDLAAVEDYDVIILDWMLPKMAGPEISKQLRKEGIRTPILMLTAKTMVEDRVKGLDSGADDYLGKPFAFSELLARIRALNRRNNQTAEQQEINQLKTGSLQLDQKSYQVTRFDQKIKLSKKEFALLEFLMRHPQQVLSKYQLVEHVWPYTADVTANTAQVYIGYLRKKIDKPFKDKPGLIQTVRGFGYKLVPDDET